MTVLLAGAGVLVGVVLLGLLCVLAVAAVGYEQAAARHTAAWWAARVAVALVLAVALDGLWRL